MTKRIFRSLFWFLLSMGLTIWSGLAFAQTPQSYWQQGRASNSIKYPTAELACKGQVEKNGPMYVYAFVTVTSASAASCYYYFNKATKETFFGQMDKLTCSTTTPYFDPVSGACSGTPPVDPNACTDKNPFIRTWIYGPKGPYVPPSNFGGCTVVPEAMLVCRKVSSTTTHCMWRVHRTGDKYSGPQDTGAGSDVADNPTLPPVKSPPITNTDKTPENTPCPAGTVHAGADSSGIPMCIGMGTDPKQTPPTTPPKIETSKDEQQADGSTKNTTTTTITNSDGSTTTHTTITVTRPDGSRDVTHANPVTGQTPIGTEGKEDKPEEQSDLCKLNPMLTICRNSSVTGSCGQIACQGDAIQCATLRAAAAMECRQRQDIEELKASPLAAVGQAAIDGDTKGLPTPKNAQVVNLPTMETQGWLANGAPFKDASISLQGHEVVIPFSKWVEYLLPLRYALMIVASLVSFRILGGAILRE